MQSFYDYKKYAILYVDDEEKSLKYFVRAFEEHFRIFTATNADDGYKILEQHKDEIALLMTDQRMPGQKGVQLLERARQLRPRIIRMLATAYSDLDAAIDAVNSGAIYKYISKPWDVPQLETTLRRGLEFFIVQRERDELLREKLSVLHDMMITDRVMSLGILSAGLSHHIRNSLVAVRTFLDLAPSKLNAENIQLDELRNPNFWGDFYQQVQSQVKRIIELLNDLGMVSSTAPQQFPDAVQLKTALASIFEGTRAALQQKQIVVDNQIPDGLPELHVDAVKFQRLLELLVKDEAANLPAGSRITVKACAVALDRDPAILLEIEDNGPGLPKEALRSIFDPFFVRNGDPQEYGLNLMACYLIVYHHGGKIEVTSPAAGGSRFAITLPVNPQARTALAEEKDFLAKVIMNETLWEKLVTTA
jgi:two-component system probable response regulator PhcQ